MNAGKGIQKRKTYIKSWNKEVAIMLEEDAFFDGKSCKYIHPRQTKMIVIDWENDK